MDYPVRKSTRLKGYDYSKAGAYYLTICSENKKHIFGKVIRTDKRNAVTCLTDAGEVVRQTIEYQENNNKNITINKYVIMPNHIHMIVFIRSNVSIGCENGVTEKSKPTNALIPKFISSLKRYTNKICGNNLWQISYYDHIIRNESDYRQKWQYIDENPKRWIEDEYYS
jgi:putative transposase